MKQTKKALVMSVLSVMLCAAMLVGGTFAWFTDNASTDVNKIVSGDLDVALYMKDGDNWVTAEGETLSFTNVNGETNILWEPGATFKLPELKIVNDGNLALQYKVLVNGVSGDLMLADVLDVFVNDEKIGTLAEVMTKANGFKTGVMNTKGEEFAFAIKMQMQTSAGNTYENKTLNGLSITVVATQQTYEKDMTNDQYDAKATYPVVDQTALDAALETAQAGDIVDLTTGAFALENNLPAGVSVTGAGADKTSITVPANQAGTRVTGLQVKEPGTTISGATLVKNDAITSDQYAGVLAVKAGDTTLDNLNITTNNNAAAVVIDSFKEGVVTLSNSTLKSGFKTVHIADGANGKVVIDNCDITGTYTFNVNSASSKDLVVDVIDSKLHGWTSYGDIKEANFTNVEFSKGASAYNYLRTYADTTFTGCNFSSDFKLNAGAVVTITITDSYFNGVKLTAANIKDMLDIDDTVKSCIITVDGVKVTF